MCIDCSQQSNVHELIESKKFDNWKNQVYKSNEENRGRYLQENYPQNAFLLKDKLSKVPILKAGSDTNLQAVSINKIKINLKNTNAFDMLFQMLLTISLDSDIVCDYLSRYNDENNFIKLIQEATKSGISLKTYRKRVEILLSYAQKGDLQFDCQVLDCNIDAGYLWKELVDNVPYGLKRTEKCDAGCEEVVSQLNFPLLEIAVLKDKNFNENLNRIIFENDKCSVKNCDGNLEGSVTTEHIIIFGIISHKTSDATINDQAMSLREFPKTLKLPTMTAGYTLRGIISCQSLRESRSASKENVKQIVRSYIAFCLRNNQWTEFNYSAKIRPSSHQVVPHLVVYSK
ncbi:unnamed protein product [Parnassius mnemosyne]